MKKKTVIILIVVFCFLLCFLLGYIVVNRFIIKNDNEVVQSNNNLEQGIQNSNEQNINDKNGGENENTKVINILPNSRIGMEILKYFEITNTYSSEFYKLLDSENLSDKVKTSMAFINIMQGKNYVYMLEFSEETADTYITKQNMQTAINDIFYNSKDTFSKDVIYDFKYDEENSRYVIPAVGMNNKDSKIAIEVPYEILEYSDRYELSMYRVYLEQKMQEKEGEEEVHIKNTIYYDEYVLNQACEITEDAINSDLNSQRDIIKKYIDDKKIDSLRLTKVKYTLVKDGENYKISKYEKLV